MPLSAVPPRKVLTLNPYTTCFFLPAIKTFKPDEITAPKKENTSEIKKKKKKKGNKNYIHKWLKCSR